MKNNWCLPDNKAGELPVPRTLIDCFNVLALLSRTIPKLSSSSSSLLCSGASVSPESYCLCPSTEELNKWRTARDSWWRQLIRSDFEITQFQYKCHSRPVPIHHHHVIVDSICALYRKFKNGIADYYHFITSCRVHGERRRGVGTGKAHASCKVPGASIFNLIW